MRIRFTVEDSDGVETVLETPSGARIHKCAPLGVTSRCPGITIASALSVGDRISPMDPKLGHSCGLITAIENV